MLYIGYLIIVNGENIKKIAHAVCVHTRRHCTTYKQQF